MSLTILMTGTLALLGLELVRIKRGRERQASLAGAPGRRSGNAIGLPADSSQRHHHVALERPGMRSHGRGKP
jgi:hypothetical protein